MSFVWYVIQYDCIELNADIQRAVKTPVISYKAATATDRSEYCSACHPRRQNAYHWQFTRAAGGMHPWPPHVLVIYGSNALVGIILAWICAFSPPLGWELLATALSHQPPDSVMSWFSLPVDSWLKPLFVHAHCALSDDAMAVCKSTWEQRLSSSSIGRSVHSLRLFMPTSVDVQCSATSAPGKLFLCHWPVSSPPDHTACCLRNVSLVKSSLELTMKSYRKLPMYVGVL